MEHIAKINYLIINEDLDIFNLVNFDSKNISLRTLHFWNALMHVVYCTQLNN